MMEVVQTACVGITPSFKVQVVGFEMRVKEESRGRGN